MTPQEQVKRLRELEQAPSATAPPKFYAIDGACVVRWGSDSNGGARFVINFRDAATKAERAAVLDALNALAEKEADRG